MKKNPFYGMSAAAMLFGCYMLNHALRLEPGHVGKLLTLMGVLQIYEALLLGLGTHLVVTRRAPRDGLTVLMLGTLFLLDATLLATECVTADAGVGTVVSLVLVGLAVAKVAYVRRVLPHALPAPAALLLGMQAALVFLLPVAVSQLASARLVTPLTLYGLWWITLALPLAQKVIANATHPTPGEASPVHMTWTWLPALAVLGHLAALEWIHQVAFHIAFLAPFLLGRAIAVERHHVGRQIAFPALAVLLSLGQSEALGFPLWGENEGSIVSPLRLATLGAAGAYTALAWRHGYRWLVALAAASGVLGLLGASVASIADSVEALARLVARLLPRNVLGWGLSGVVAAFVSLALGAWRSLRGEGHRPPPAPRPAKGPPRGAVTAALLLAALATGSMLWALDSYPVGHARQRSAALTSAALAVAALVLGAWAQSRASGPPEDPAGKQAATLALFAGIGGLLVSCPVFSAAGRHVSRSESWVIGDIRTVISAQAAYQTQNAGHADARLSCLAQPSECIPGYESDQPSFLDAALASLADKKGYRRSFHPGGPPDAISPGGSPTSVSTWAYVAVPLDPGYSGIRGFCGDSRGQIFFTANGSAPSLASDGTCDPDSAHPLN